MKRTKIRDRIVFLSVPESLRGQIEQLSDHAFSIDPSIPIPVEIPPGEATLNLEHLSWEMILSGMIKVVASDGEGEDADYYRRFVLAVKPDIRMEFTEAAILKAKNGDFAVAMEILEALGGLFPGDPGIALNIALVMEEKADGLEQAGLEEEAEEAYDRAFGFYRSLLAREPPFPNGLFNAGFFFLKRRNYDRAKECFGAYIPVAEDSKKKNRAQAIVKEIASRNLDDETFREAYDFIRMGKEEEGIEKARDFLLRHPEVWNGWFLLGWGLRRMGRWADAELAFRKALELGGDGADTRNELSLCLLEQGDLDGARKELEAALRQESENVKVISNLGVVALKSGRKEEAAGFFRTVLELEPRDQVAAQYLAELGTP